MYITYDLSYVTVSMDTLLHLGQGNNGALTVLRQLVLLGIDGVICMNTLKTLNIKGPMIWMLYKDVCREDIYKVTSILSAYTNGNLSEEDLIYSINNRGRGVDITQY